MLLIEFKTKVNASAVIGKINKAMLDHIRRNSKKIKIMAKIELPAFIKSMSGTISKKKLADGTMVSCIVTKKNRMYIRPQKPRTSPPTKNEKEKREKFGIIAQAMPIVRKEVAMGPDPETQKRIWSGMSDVYDLLKKRGMKITAKLLAEKYAYLEW